MKINKLILPISTFLIISILSTTSVISQTTIITNRNEKKYLHFKIYQSEINYGKYDAVVVDSTKFENYDDKKIENPFGNKPRMITLQSALIIDTAAHDELVLVFPPVNYACNIYLNGTLIAQRGDIYYGYSSRSHTTESYLLSPTLLDKKNEIVIELLAKFGETAPVNGIFICSRKIGETYTFWRNLFNVGFIRAMMLTTFIIFLYFVIFYFQRKAENTSFYLSLAFVCFFYSIAYANNIITFNFSDTLLLEKISRLGLGLWTFLTPVYILEFTRITKYKNHIIIGIAIIYLPVIFLGWLPDTVPQVIAFNMKYTLVLTVLIDIISIVFCYVFAFRTRTKYAFVLAFLYLLAIPVIAFDLYYFIVLQTKSYMQLLPYLMFAVMVVFFFVVAWQQSAVYKLASLQSDELKHINENLEELVKQRTLKLKASEERLSLALQGSSDGLWDWNLQTNDVFFSPTWKSMLGYSEDELENKFDTWLNLVHPDDLQAATTLLNEFLNKQHLHYESEFRMVHKNGEIITILSRAIKQFDDQTGKVQRLAGTHVNLTNIRKAEVQIRKLSIAIEQSPTIVVITDYSGKIEYVNPKFTEQTGYTLEEVKGNNPRILNSGKTNKNVFVELWQTITSGKIWKGEFINKKKNGQEFIESALIAPIFDNNQNIVNYIAVKEDITTRKQFEDALKKSEAELKELNLTKDKFFSIIAHDLRNPFNTILGFSDLLINYTNKYDKEKILQFSNAINTSARTAYKLLENLLEWSHLQTGKIELYRTSFVLEHCIIDVINITEPIALKKNIVVGYEIKQSIELFADKNMIHTVLRNLLTNAIKFTNRDGKVLVKADIDENHVCVSITDNGVGMSENKIAELFKINIKTSTKGTEKEPGTGLGLLLCKEFIAMHNGTIWVESEIDKGSTFYFTLPLAQELT